MATLWAKLLYDTKPKDDGGCSHSFDNWVAQLHISCLNITEKVVLKCLK